MATPAPAATSTETPKSAPAAPAPAQQQQQQTQQPTGEQAPAPKPKPTLEGVHRGSRLFQDEQIKERKAASGIKPIPPRRDETGRFQPPDGKPRADAGAAAAPAGKEAGAAAPAIAPSGLGAAAPPTATEQPPAAGKFTFAGHEFESQEQAAAVFKSAMGQQKRANEAVTAAHSWQQAYHNLKAELDQLRSSGAATSQAPGSVNVPAPVAAPNSGVSAGAGRTVAPAPAGGILEALDQKKWDNFRAFAQRDGLDVGLAYLLREVDNHYSQRFEQMLNQRLEPIAPIVQNHQLTQRAVGVFEQVASVQWEGQHVYPELQDQTQALEVVDVWKRLQLPEEVRHTPFGVQQAVMAYRLMKQQQLIEQLQAAAAQPPTPQPALPAPPAPAASTATRTAPSTMEPNAAPHARAGATPDKEADLRRRIREARGTHPTLGIRR